MNQSTDQHRARGHCTASVGASRRDGVRRPPRWWLPTLALLLLLPLLSRPPVAVADTELGHHGATGRHRLADLYDSPGAVCDIVRPGPDSLGETWLRVNPPIMFARDRTAGIDKQVVGWQAVISALDARSETWHVVRRSEIARDVASDELASYFDGQGWLAEFPVSQATYAASVEMIWYDPHDPTRIEGRAVHGIEHFMVILRYNGEVAHGRTAGICQTPR